MTAKGIQKIDAPTSIKQIEEELLRIIPIISNDANDVDTFLNLKEKYSNQKLLLFIDNLETLLRDDPNEFNEFQFSLPVTWRVLVTSRITINSSTCLSIAPLQDKNAKHLTRLYALRRNASGLVNDAAIDKIVQRIRCNPLAIRLGVDAYVLGSPLDDSLDLAAKDVLSFSYKNLLEVISSESRAILECLFIQDPQSRIELAENLGASIDTIATGLGELSRTSLILRNNEDREEMYSLYPSIRDLLLINPLDPVSREKVQDIIFRRRESIVGNDHRQIRLSRFHTDYVDPELQAVVREICYETNDTVRQLHKKKTPEQALRLLERLRRLKSEFPNIPIIPRCIAKLHAKLGDSGTALTELTDAISIDPSDIRLLQELARLAHDTHKYDIALQYYAQIKQQVGWDIQKTDENTVRYCLNGYLIALLYSGKNKAILDETQDWDSNPILKDIMGVFRARAWKRSIEKQGSLDEKTHALKKAANILSEISKLYGHTRQTNGSFREVIEEIANCTDLAGFASTKETLQLLIFSESHITNVFQDLGEDVENVLSFVLKFRNVNIHENPFKNTQWREFLQSKGGKVFVDAEFKENLKQEDYTFVKIYHIPKAGSAFVFARDDSGKEYFIHSDVVGPSSRREWNKLIDGVEMAIRTDSSTPRHGKAHAAIEAHILSA